MAKKKTVAPKTKTPKEVIEEVKEVKVQTETIVKKTIGGKEIIKAVDQGQYVIVTDIDTSIYKLPKSEYDAL